MPLLLSLPPGAALLSDERDRVELKAGSDVLRIPSRGAGRAMERLVAGPANQDDLTGRVIETDGWVGFGGFLSLLLDLTERRLLSCLLVADGVRLATACPVPIELLVGEDDGAEQRKWVVSRFARPVAASPRRSRCSRRRVSVRNCPLICTLRSLS